MTTTSRPIRRTHLCIALSVALAACGGEGGAQLPIQRAPLTGIAHPAYARAIAVAESLSAALTVGSPAISVAVAVGDSVVWSAAFGFNDLDAQRRATPADRFRIYSLTKAQTAATALWLARRGALDLDAPVSRYVAAAPAGVTTRQLLGHLGGVRHYKGGEAITTRSCARPIDALEFFGDDALVSTPGSSYLYSSWGYALVSAVIEAAGAAPFDSLLAQAVFVPAGMSQSGFPASAALGSKEVQPYELARRGMRPARSVNNRCKWGGGALVATAEDVARFGAALLGERIIPREALAEMLSPMRTADGTSTDYAMGLGVSTDSTGLRRAVHSGSAIGGRSALVMLPDEKVVVVVLSNVEGDRLTPVALAIAHEFRRP